MEEQLVYNNDLLRGVYIYDKCHSFLRVVSEKDYPGTKFFNPEIECLDMDHYEKNVCRVSQANNTVDAVIGIESYKDNRFSNGRLLLMELRMGYKSVNNLSVSEMLNKVKHTKDYLRDYKVEKKSYFIFSESLIHHAISWFDRKRKECGDFACCIPVSVSGFDRLVCSKSDVPITYIYSEEEIRRDIESKKNSSEFIAQVVFWLDRSKKYGYGNRNEREHIVSVVKELWKSFKDKTPDLSGEDQVYVEILEEDYGLMS